MNGDLSWFFQLREELAGQDLLVSRDRTAGESGESFLVRGGTFQLQATLAGLGAAWDPTVAAWRLESAGQLLKLAAAVRPAASAAEVTYGHAPGEEEDWSLGEGDDTPLLFGGNLVGRRVDPRIRRLAKLPTEVLEPEELLAVMVGLGTSFPKPEQLAASLLKRFDSLGAVLGAERSRYAECLPPDEGGDGALWDSALRRQEHLWELATLLKTVHELLRQVLGEKLKERPVIGSWTALVDYLAAAMQHETAEHFRILFLDRKNLLIRDEVQSRGTVDHTPLYPREVVKRALELAASAIIMVHNHPSGDPTPSGPDVEMTKQVVAALGQVGITVHDHIIVGKNRHTSFRGLKLL